MTLDVSQRQRYARHLLLSEIGASGQARLIASSVQLDGRDATAAAALDYLVAAGVGEIRISEDGAAPESLLPIPEKGMSWRAAAAAVALRLNPQVRIVPAGGGSDTTVGVRLTADRELIRSAAWDWTARISRGGCQRCTDPQPTAAAKPQSALFAGSSAAAEMIKALLGIPGFDHQLLLARLDVMRFERSALPGCAGCRSRS